MIILPRPIWLLTPKGEAQAWAVTDPGPGQHLLWHVFVDKTGESWTFRNPEIRRNTSLTDGYDRVTPFSDVTLRRFEDHRLREMPMATTSSDLTAKASNGFDGHAPDERSAGGWPEPLEALQAVNGSGRAPPRG